MADPIQKAINEARDKRDDKRIQEALDRAKTKQGK